MQKLSSTPWSIQVELTRGCNRVCMFCGVSGLQGGKPGGPYDFMTVDTAKVLAQKFAEGGCGNRRFEFAMRGEPTMNPNYLEILSVFRERLPKAQIMLTTNGVRMRKGKMEKTLSLIFDSGVDFVMLDTYYPERDELWEAVFSLPEHSFYVYDFYKDEQCPNPYHNHHRKVQRTVIVADDLGTMVGGKAQKNALGNHCGNALDQPRLERVLEKRCTKPFREMVVHYNGNVNLCCEDFAAEFNLGNLAHTDSTVAEVWHSQILNDVRTLLYWKERKFVPCARCNYSGGMRQGLLPAMPKPTPKVRQRVEAQMRWSAKHTKQTQAELMLPSVHWNKRERGDK